MRRMRIIGLGVAIAAVGVVVSGLAFGGDGVSASREDRTAAKAIVAAAERNALRKAADGVTRAEYEAAFASYRACLERRGFTVASASETDRGVLELTAVAPLGMAPARADSAFASCGRAWDVVNAVYASSVAPSPAERSAGLSGLDECLESLGLSLDQLGPGSMSPEASACVERFGDDNWIPIPGIESEVDSAVG